MSLQASQDLVRQYEVKKLRQFKFKVRDTLSHHPNLKTIQEKSAFSRYSTSTTQWPGQTSFV